MWIELIKVAELTADIVKPRMYKEYVRMIFSQTKSKGNVSFWYKK